MHLTTKPLSVLIGTVIIPAVGIAAPDALLKSEYEKIRNERNQAPVFSAGNMDANAAKFLDVVKSDWEARSSECPDSAFAKISGLTGVSGDVVGVVAFYTHRTPPYSAADHRRNAKEAVFAATLTLSLPISVDNLIHTKEGLAYIKNSKNWVTVFEDTGKGLSRTVYLKPVKDEDGADQPGPAQEPKTPDGEKQKAPSTDTSDPEAVAKAFITALSNNNAQEAAQYVIPEERDEITKEMEKGMPPLPKDPDIKVRVKDDGVRADVFVLNAKPKKAGPPFGLDMKLNAGRWWIVK